MQISQLFLNAEHPQRQVPVTPLPAQQPELWKPTGTTSVPVPQSCSSSNSAADQAMMYQQLHAVSPSDQMYMCSGDIISTALNVANNM